MKERILGVDVSPIDMPEVLHQAEIIIQKKSPSFIVAINPEKIMKAVKDQKLKELLNSASIQIPDGVGILIASKLRGGCIKNRVTGIDLMLNLCNLSSSKGYKIYMLGASPGIAERAALKLSDMYPGIIISGTHDGYFNGNEAELIEEIRATKSDIIFVAMGSPKQEYWIRKNLDKLQVPLLMGVGGSFDVICGNIKRAPQIMCRFGLEWLYRLIKEPWRFKRMLALPVFIIKAVRSN